jgi:GAF domain-containing protein
MGMIATTVLFAALIAGAIFLTRRIMLRRCAIKEAEFIRTVTAIEQNYRNLQTTHAVLYDELKRAGLFDTFFASKQRAIDAVVDQIMKRVHATAGSVYVPRTEAATAKTDVDQLVFLSILPMNETAQALRRRPIPLASFAGRCYTEQQPSLILYPKSLQEICLTADQIAELDTESSINIPLRHAEQVIGVLQLIRRAGPHPFTDEDLVTVKGSAEAFAPLVAEFLAVPGGIQWLCAPAEPQAPC